MDKNIICSRCVLDTSVPDIVFDENGVCNYCHAYDRIIAEPAWRENPEQKLSSIIETIKRDGRNKDYDCVIGLSGGVDSSFLADMLVERGLRPLAVHVDTGWNSEIAVKNIENIVKKLNIDLYTYVIDWEEMRDLQRAFFYASVPDCDVPQDHVFPAVLHKVTKQHKLHHLISGHNLVTEFVLPKAWVYDSNDLTHLKYIHRQFGLKKLKKYPKYSLFDRIIYYRILYRIKSHRFLFYINYNKEKAKKHIIEKFAWRDYGGKHCESRFTKFFQSYYLTTKFGYDKRKAHLSNLIVSNQITRSEALRELEKPPYDPQEIAEDIKFVCRKLSITEEEWDAIMKLPIRRHSDYPSDYDKLWYKVVKFVHQYMQGPIFSGRRLYALAKSV